MGKYFLILLSVFLWGCELSTKRAESEEAIVESESLDDSTEHPVPEEYSIREDREQLAELRKAIPQDRQKENDELAAILSEMAGETRHPSKIRQKWSKGIRKKRDKFNKEMRKLRKDFNKNEKASRKNFLKTQKDLREQSTGKGTTRDQRTEFYRKQDEDRREYFANERDKRKDFESNTREKRRDFDDYIRERNKTFNDEIRAYRKRFNERKKQLEKEKRMKKKAERLKKKENRMRRTKKNQLHPNQGGLIQKPQLSPQDQSIVNEIEEAKKIPGKNLGSGE